MGAALQTPPGRAPRDCFDLLTKHTSITVACERQGSRDQVRPTPVPGGWVPPWTAARCLHVASADFLLPMTLANLQVPSPSG